jgi:hypothetical protein
VRRFIADFGLVCLTALALGACGMPTAAPRPEIKHGYAWTYEEVDNQSGVVLRTVEERAQNVGSGPAGVWRTQSARDFHEERSANLGEDWNPDGIDDTYDFPLAPRDSWIREASFRPPDSRGRTQLRGTVKVLGWEVVRVPAGWFRALRIEGNYEWSARDGALQGTETIIRWYAPAAQREVKIIRRVSEAGSDAPFRDETVRLTRYGSLNASQAKHTALALALPFAGLVAFGVLGSALTFRLAYVIGPQRDQRYPVALWRVAILTGLAAVLFVPVIAAFVSGYLGDALDLPERIRLRVLLGANAVLFLLWLTGFAYRRGVASRVFCLLAATGVIGALTAMVTVASRWMEGAG